MRRGAGPTRCARLLGMRPLSCGRGSAVHDMARTLQHECALEAAGRRAGGSAHSVALTLPLRVALWQIRPSNAIYFANRAAAHS
jgi:hypothetical protein